MAANTATAGEETPHFGTMVRQHRLRIGLTQRELADFSTISVRAIRDIEQGKARRPRLDTVRLLADGLRLGPRARAAFETAAHHGLAGRALQDALRADPPGPPAAPGPIVGRAEEVAVIADELRSGAERLVTVVGLGGVGKTRLALEVAGRLRAEDRYPVLWYTLPGTSPRSASGPFGELARACADDLFGPGDGKGVALLAELAGDAPALLVIDGVGAPRPRGDRLAWLLRRCPDLRVLVTADEPCGVPGERRFLLSPLEVPGPDGAPADAPALRLFHTLADRTARRVHTTPAETAQAAAICRLLDGVPLALAAAASWLLIYDMPTLLRSLTAGPAELLDHLGGTEGTSGLPEALARCVGGLPAEDAELLAALSAGDGGFGLDDVVAVTGRSLPDSGRTVRGLLLRGLVRTVQEPGMPPFRVPETVRATAARMPGQLPIRTASAVSHGL
ncbi:helix-turn-helix domain-containing protein [Actinocorallia sp. API 0066]|uniref:helix-turn-helix domain-containing protein n=1 Tax=Actinocorallia sp. API 0066 TaxID=2896846 RepID=UPI001E4D9FD7|nr:helix-turn-helix transcriptional regulator [Actinocorallia sp. API 0066]MCD0449348.1 helix-turn-helix domain-containing protein [Actinocorallia sp. API 0066]